ncbi:MAG: hypothetical protein ACOH1E_08265 [Brevundimonas sp.]
MSRLRTHANDRTDAWLLDEEVWDSPGYLTDLDLFVHAGPDWRRGTGALDDPEDDQ